MRVSLVSLGEAGNFGDDLILLSVLSSIGEADPKAEVQILSFGQHIPLEQLGADPRMTFPRVVSRASGKRYWPVVAERQRHFDDPDVIIVGGGGLLQTSHHPLRPYHWLGYIPNKDIPVLGVGLGLGPLSLEWERFFQTHGSPFSKLFVRDSRSRNMAESYGWQVSECMDFIDADFLTRLSAVASECNIHEGLRTAGPRTLGVALRQWPGLQAREVAIHVERIANHHRVERIRFFVLEPTGGEGPDMDFTRNVTAALSWEGPIEHFEYRSSNLIEFLNTMREVDVAISMKLHSSAYWANFGVSIFPIIYAPKVASFFGVPYRGLEILSEAHGAAQNGSRLSAREVVAMMLESEQLDRLKVPPFRFSQAEHTILEGMSIGINAWRSAKRTLGKERI